MSVRKLTAALVALALLAPATSAFAQTQPAADGWYTAETAPEVGPKPPCGKKPNKKEEFVAMWYLKDGQYTVCQWDSQGAKVKPAYTGWGWFQCNMQTLVSADECRLGVLNNRGITPTQYFSGGFQPNYQGFQPGYNGYQQPSTIQYNYGSGPQRLRPGERYHCPQTNHPDCYKVP